MLMEGLNGGRETTPTAYGIAAAVWSNKCGCWNKARGFKFI